jgi:phosphate uptake regulator
MKEAEGIVLNMLHISYDMFQYSMKVVIEKEKEKEDIYKIDQKLNQLQIEVRRDILEHLAINPAQDIIPSLILTTIVVDIERIGDYSKNLIELSHKYPKPLKGKYIEEIKDLEGKVQNNFKKLIDVYKEQNQELGSRIMKELIEVSNECQSMLEDIVEDESLRPKEGIIYALLLRYLKRVSVHIKNVASSVVNPFHRLGYKPEEKVN